MGIMGPGYPFGRRLAWQHHLGPSGVVPRTSPGSIRPVPDQPACSALLHSGLLLCAQNNPEQTIQYPKPHPKP